VNRPEAVLIERQVTCAVCMRPIIGPAPAWKLGGRVFVHDAGCVVVARITEYDVTTTVKP
jgi:hypothetical protein